jgi:prepilin-type N-terminal cleavage/methylation domain-containing protein
MRRFSRRGFTIIELMIVMAIILILVSLVVVGVRVLNTNARKDQTRTMLQALNGISSELKVKSPPTSPIFYSMNPALPLPGPMLAPGDVTSDGGQGANGRNNAMAILATASVLAQAQAISDVQTAINSLPANQLLSFQPPLGRVWVWVPNGPYRLGLDFVEDDDVSQLPSGPPVEHVFQCNATPPSSPLARPGSDSADWGSGSPSANSASVRIPLDGWGNPIIFVPASGLTGVKLADGNYHTIVSPDGLPFWASAGPDGNFTNGDDNIYSFQK